jgi:hypothetical protein
MHKEKNIWKELEVGFGGSSKFRIILHLVLNHDEVFTKYAIVKSTGLKTRVVEKHLKKLIELRWVKKYPFTPPTYQANMENKVVKQFHSFLSSVKYT